MNAELNLNNIPVWDEDGSGYARETLATFPDKGIAVYFDNLADRLCSHIRVADMVLGCTAWLTEPKILDALSQTNASIVVQKEDFLRPDKLSRRELHEAYAKIKNKFERHLMPGVLGRLNVCGDPTMFGVSCCGNYNRDRHPAWPRMHHKFLVFCKASTVHGSNDNDGQYAHVALAPYGVWTGSFNPTVNAGRSFENAVYIYNHDVGHAFLKEFMHVYALSEPLDWESVWMAPEYRIGS